MANTKKKLGNSKDIHTKSQSDIPSPNRTGNLNNSYPEIDNLINDIFKTKKAKSNKYTEEELIADLRQHDEAAYQFLFDNYASPLFAIIKQIVSKQEVAEDILQETFVKIWQNITSYDASKGRLYVWMVSVARNISIDRMNSKTLSKQNAPSSFLKNLFITFNVEESKISDEDLKKVLTALPDEEAKLIDLAYFKGFTQEEISKILMIPVNTVKEEMRNTIESLRNTIKSYVNDIISSNNKVLMPSLSNKQENSLTPMEKMEIVRSGITKRDLEQLKEKTKLDYEKLAEILLVDSTTLKNKKNNEKFDSSTSERILSLADLYSYGYEVFDNEENFNEWIFTPNRALGEEIPYNVMSSQFGREEIRNIIGRIDYGVYS